MPSLPTLLVLLWATACRLDVNGDLTRDADGDGVSILDGDCDDAESRAFPGNEEVPYDGVDNDCQAGDLTDVDGDGYDGLPAGGIDCDDEQAWVNPGAAEIWYDGTDGDCDGTDDFDQDADGYVPDAYVGLTTEGVQGSGTLPGGDCDDQEDHVNPGESEVWYDGVDADCDGADDYDQDGDGYESDEHGGEDCDDLDATRSPGAEEVAGDGRDNDCVNQPPTIDDLGLTPSEVYTDDLIIATVTTSDVDGDAVEVGYDWYVEGIHLDGVVSNVLASSWFERDQLVYLVVTPNDGTEDGDPVASAYITVGNSAPVIHDATISPAAPVEGDTLNVGLSATDDDDEDAARLSYQYAWYVDGSLVTTSSTLSSASFAKGQAVYVVVTASDGTDASAPFTSATLTVANSLPVVASVLLSPSHAYTADMIEAQLGGTRDADGDPVTVSFAWYVDGSSVGATGSTLDGATWFDKDQQVQVVVTPNDGEDDGLDLTSSTLTVLNTVPEAPEITLEPESPIPGVDDLVCDVTLDAYDADGDVVTYAFAWRRDGHLWTGATTTWLSGDTVPATATGEGEEWTCTATPDDGDGSGSAATASVLVGCDSDGDGYDGPLCAGTDCDDHDATIHPGAAEVWYDGVDQDCDGDSDFDADGDGYLADTYSGTDCDDTTATVHPGATETCEDGVDNDCDGTYNGCWYSGTVSETEADATFLAEEYASWTSAGWIVTMVGDTNRDGFADMLVSTVSQSVYGGTTAQYLVLGPSSGESVLSDADAVFYLTVSGLYWSVAAGGDVDGDGSADLLFGRYSGAAPTNGEAYLTYGSFAGSMTLSSASADASFLGEASGDNAGTMVACAGDVNDDGFDDILVGATGTDTYASCDGSASLFFGPLSGVQGLSSAATTFVGEGSNQGAGTQVSGAGDVDGDGFDDILVGAPGNSSGGASAGAIYLVSTSVTGVVSLSAADAKLTGENPWDSLGIYPYGALAGAGDTNADGYADFLIGLPSSSFTGSSRGSVYLILGPISGTHSVSSADAKLVGISSGDYAGSSASSGGDIDGDGFDDLLVGAPSRRSGSTIRGAAYVLRGPISGAFSLSYADVEFLGATDNGQFGVGVSGGGDVDGDGFDDVLIGDPYHYDSARYAWGAAFVFYGSGF